MVESRPIRFRVSKKLTATANCITSFAAARNPRFCLRDHFEEIIHKAHKAKGQRCEQSQKHQPRPWGRRRC